jgi:hypothetical membrane protein
MSYEKEKVIQMTNTIRTAGTSSTVTETKLTHLLLACGVIAGPLYLIVGLIQAFTRPGFDITRHSLSLLSNGDWGWVHITNLILTGLLTMAGAVGIRRALHTGIGSTWGPWLIGLYGLSLIGAGVFLADPALGFPPGTPADAINVSWHGLLHLAVGAVGFLALIAACFVLARRFASQQRGWMLYSVITGVVFFAAFIGIASGQGNPWTILGFWIGVVLAWSWISALSARLMNALPAATP